MKSHRVSTALVMALTLWTAVDAAQAAEAKTKIVAKPAVRSRNYGAVHIRTADLTPQTQFDFKTIQWGYGPGYYRGIYGYGAGWGYYNYYRPYAAYYPYYGYRSAYYAYGPSYAYYDPAFAYAAAPAYYGRPVYSYRGYGGGYGGYAGDYGGCYHW